LQTSTFTLEFLEDRSAADQRAGLLVKSARDFSGEGSVSKANTELTRFDESCSHDLDDGSSSAGSALGFYLEHPDGRVEKS